MKSYIVINDLRIVNFLNANINESSVKLGTISIYVSSYGLSQGTSK